MSSIDRINGYTAKRWGLKQTLRAAAAVGAHSLLSGRAEDPLRDHTGISSDDVLAMLEDAVGERPAAISVLWPWPVRTTRLRVYVHAFARNGTPLAFVKISLPGEHSALSDNESQMLRLLADEDRATVLVPRLIASGMFGAAAFIAVEPLPLHLRSMDAHAMFPETIAREIAGPVQRSPLLEVVEQPWWTGVFSALTAHPALNDRAMSALGQSGLTASRVHGDFSQKNILCDSERVWVVDWETGCTSGPHLTDELAFLLHRESSQVRRRPDVVLADLDKLATRQPQGWLDVTMGLAYLAAVSLPEAAVMIGHWAHREKH